jgi:hypothetical protein
VFGRGQEETQEHVLFTDASNSGWGATLFGCPWGIKIFYGQWAAVRHKQPIDELEMLAITNALQAMKSEGFTTHGATLLLAIDNTSIIGSVQDENAVHHKWGISQGCAEMRQKMRDLGITRLKVMWVASVKNLADAPSRFFQQLRSADDA